MISSSIGPHDQLLDLLSCQNFDLSMGYRQIKSEPTIFVIFSYSWLFPQAYTIISFGSEQCYHLVHIIVVFHLYGNLDELLLSPSATFLPSPWFVLNIQLVLETLWTMLSCSVHEAYTWMKEVTSSNSCAFDASCRREFEKACFYLLWNHPKSIMHVRSILWSIRLIIFIPYEFRSTLSHWLIC